MGFCMGLARAQPACVKGLPLDHLFLSGPDVGIELAAFESELRRWCTEKKFALPAPKVIRAGWRQRLLPTRQPIKW
jgi:hypothetical protein